MQKPDLKNIVIKETIIISSCFATAFGLRWLGAFFAGSDKALFSIQLTGILYLASVAFRVAGLFIRMTFKLAFMLALIGIALLFLAGRYPAFFAFLK